MSNLQQIEENLLSNRRQLHVMELPEFIEIAQKVRQVVRSGQAKSAAGHAPLAMDIVSAGRLIREFGFTGRAVPKMIGGKPYILLAGDPRLRQHLPGTRYSARHPKVLEFGIGRYGRARGALKGARLTLYFTVPMTVLEECLKDKFSLSRLIGTLATDVAKIAVATTIAALAGAAVGAVTTIVAAPVIAVIVVGSAVGLGLQELDQRLSVTETLIRELDALYDRTAGEMGRQLWEVEQQLRQQHLRGEDVGEGIFY